MDGTIERAEGLIKSGRLEDALSALSGLLEAAPDDARALMDLGVASHGLSRHGEAEAAFRRVLELDPSHREARKSLCMTLLAEGRKEECGEALDSFAEGIGEDHASLAFAATLYQALGRPCDAREHIDRAIGLAGFANHDEYRDLRAAISGLPKPSRLKYRPEVAVLCGRGMDSFIHGVAEAIAPYCTVRKTVGDHPSELLKGIAGAGTVWLEWGNQMTQAVLQQKERLRGKQVIVRIHSYEVIDGLVDRLDYSAVTDLVFVSSYIRDLFLAKGLKLPRACRVHVVHNGIDLCRFRPVPRGAPSGRIAFLGHISYKKGPMVLAQAFAFLRRRHPEATLHVGGGFQDRRFELAMRHFFDEAGLAEGAVLHGHVDDPGEWLRDKDYILCTSPVESQGIGLLEAMSRGCRPLIFNFPGSSGIYLREHLWTTFDDLEERYLNPVGPAEASAFVARHYSRDREAASWLRILHGRETVVEDFGLNRTGAVH
ncbi:MAG: glycosyltransferase [Deltaproteobacteria bacterium]|jgi:glycosyltransferase involved in cell wall biosynthesis|nr:glycosyltransferase [Deltaproteobacteria bacterium]